MERAQKVICDILRARADFQVPPTPTLLTWLLKLLSTYAPHLITTASFARKASPPANPQNDPESPGAILLLIPDCWLLTLLKQHPLPMHAIPNFIPLEDRLTVRFEMST